MSRAPRVSTTPATPRSHKMAATASEAFDEVTTRTSAQPPRAVRRGGRRGVNAWRARSRGPGTELSQQRLFLGRDLFPAQPAELEQQAFLLLGQIVGDDHLKMHDEIAAAIA